MGIFVVSLYDDGLPYTNGPRLATVVLMGFVIVSLSALLMGFIN